MKNFLKAIAGVGIAIAAFFGGSYTHPITKGIDQPVVNEDAARVIDVLTSIDIATSSLPNLLPVVLVDSPVDKTVTASSTLEKYFVDNVVNGKQPIVNGILNSLEIQALEVHVAESKGILKASNFDENGNIDIYKEIRTNPDVTTTASSSNYADNPYGK